MNNPFRLRVPVTIGEVTLVFLDPDPDDLTELQALVPEGTRWTKELKECVADWLIDRAESARLPGLADLPADWKEQLRASRLLLRGLVVADVLSCLFQYEPEVAGPDGAGPARPGARPEGPGR